MNNEVIGDKIVDTSRGRQNFQLPAGEAFAAWKGPLQNRKPRWTKYAHEGCVLPGGYTGTKLSP